MLRFRNSSTKVASNLINPLVRSENRGILATQIGNRSSFSSSAPSSLNVYARWKLGQQLVKLKKHLDENPSERTALEYIKALVLLNPGQAITTIETGWNSGHFPVNEEFFREFIKASSMLKKLDTINYQAIFNLYGKNHPNSNLTVNGASQMADNVKFILPFPSGASSSMNGLPSGLGSSVSAPLYVTFSDNGWKPQMWKLLRHLVIGFMVIAGIGMYLDDSKAGNPAQVGSRFGVGGSAVHQAEKSDKTFDDVVGIDEAKYDLQEIVMYLKDPKKFTRLGGKLPKGILLTGPPGTGKTLLARAIAGEAKVPFFHASGSEFEEMYVGVGAKRVRELFDVAKSKSPCIIFIDEIDAIGGSRHLKDQSAMKMTLNQLLVEMDGFQQNNGVIVIAATNFPDSLDNALIRPGRFDKQVDVPMPDIGGRKAILQLYCKKIPIDSDVDLDQLSRGTPGFSGAELFNLVNQAALKASVDGAKSVSMSALEYAKDKIMMGAERKSAIISPETMKVTAYHEAGHALVALKTKGADPIHKATIMPRGRALGMVTQLPEGDQTSMTRQQMLARLDVCMGGRVAEELIFGVDQVTSGASSDIVQATRLARAMVTKYGLSSKIGVMFIDDKQTLSSQTQDEVDKEVKQLLDDSYVRAKKILQTNSQELDYLANGLLEYESLSGSEVVDITSGKKISQLKRSQRPSRLIPSIDSLKEKLTIPGIGSGNVPQPEPLTNTDIKEPSSNSTSAQSNGDSSKHQQQQQNEAKSQATNNVPSSSSSSSVKTESTQQQKDEAGTSSNNNSGNAVKPAATIPKTATSQRGPPKL